MVRPSSPLASTCGAVWLVLAVAALPGNGEAAVACHGDGVFINASEYHCQQPHPNVLLYYKVKGDFLMFGMHVASHDGWSAVGFAGNGGMKGARMIVVRRNNGAFVAEDRYAEAYSMPALSQPQEVSLLFAEVSGGSVTWGAVVPMDACTPDKDGFMRNYPIQDVSRWMLYALGHDHVFAHHKVRGQFHANLVSGPKVAQDLSGLPEVDLRMPNVSVVLGPGGTDKTNPYICGMFDLEQLVPSHNISLKLHVAKFAPYLNADSRAYVHHMILYGCDESVLPQGSTYSHGQVIPECQSMPRGCNSMKWPWAIGGEDVVFPPNVGMPFGEGKRWLALQMHYYNPRLVPDMRDSSGVRLIISKTIRQQDAGVMYFNAGTRPLQRSPLQPGQNEIRIDFTVPPACTRTWTNDVTVLGVAHHMHLIGKYSTIEVLRSGTNLGLMRQENHYDFNHQSFEESAVKVLKPGDELRMACHYDTTSRTSPTSFGDLTQTEMCFAGALYYPAQRMERPSFIPFSSANAKALADAYPGLCSTPGLGAHAGVSQCEAVLLSDALLLAPTPNGNTYGQQVSATDLCNKGVPVLKITNRYVKHGWPGLCPDCWKDSSCTDAVMKPNLNAWCKDSCSSFGFSLYPDVSRSSGSAGLPRMTSCSIGGAPFFTPASVPPKSCQRRGDLRSAAALEILGPYGASPPPIATPSPTPSPAPTPGQDPTIVSGGPRVWLGAPALALALSALASQF